MCLHLINENKRIEIIIPRSEEVVPHIGTIKHGVSDILKLYRSVVLRDKLNIIYNKFILIKIFILFIFLLILTIISIKKNISSITLSLSMKYSRNSLVLTLCLVLSSLHRSIWNPKWDYRSCFTIIKCRLCPLLSLLIVLLPHMFQFLTSATIYIF